MVVIFFENIVEFLSGATCGFEKHFPRMQMTKSEMLELFEKSKL